MKITSHYVSYCLLFLSHLFHSHVSIYCCCGFHEHRPYKVEWESTEEGRGGNNEVDIDLYYCGDSCQEVCIWTTYYC